MGGEVKRGAEGKWLERWGMGRRGEWVMATRSLLSIVCRQRSRGITFFHCFEASLSILVVIC